MNMIRRGALATGIDWMGSLRHPEEPGNPRAGPVGVGLVGRWRRCHEDIIKHTGLVCRAYIFGISWIFDLVV
jgi:hypothetical protein